MEVISSGIKRLLTSNLRVFVLGKSEMRPVNKEIRRRWRCAAFTEEVDPMGKKSRISLLFIKEK